MQSVEGEGERREEVRRVGKHKSVGRVERMEREGRWWVHGVGQAGHIKPAVVVRMVVLVMMVNGT